MLCFEYVVVMYLNFHYKNANEKNIFSATNYGKISSLKNQQNKKRKEKKTKTLTNNNMWAPHLPGLGAHVPTDCPPGHGGGPCVWAGGRWWAGWAGDVIGPADIIGPGDGIGACDVILLALTLVLDHQGGVDAAEGVI